MNPIKRNVLICLLLAPLAQGMADAAESAAGGEPSPDQVVVEGTRADLVNAAKDVIKAEQRFYERYNKLNTRRKYAVRCTEEADTGSRFKKKTCRPQYENDADSAEGREFAQALGRGNSAGATSAGGVASSGVMGTASAVVNSGSSGLVVGAGSSGAGTSAPVSGGGTVASFIEIESGRPEFQQNLIEVADKYPELRKLLEEHAAAVKRYEALFMKVNGKAPELGDRPTGKATPAQ